MRKTECPHRQPLSAVGDLWVDVALKQLHILARPFPQGQPPPMPLVSRAFPQEVTSALATHGVVPVTSVAYEQALDGHLGGSMKLHILASLPTHQVSKQTIGNRTSTRQKPLSEKDNSVYLFPHIRWDGAGTGVAPPTKKKKKCL